MGLTERATLARTFFEQDKRTDGTEYWRATNAAPDWVSPLLCRAAHDGMLPDDWRYRFTVDALDILSETDNEDEITERLDNDVDVYYGALALWLASHSERFGYCDEAAEELGADKMPISQRIQIGQLAERREVLNAVRAFLAEMDD